MHKEGLYLGRGVKPWYGIETATAASHYPLGAYFDDEYGFRYRYGRLSSAADLVAGNLVQNATLGGATTTLQSAAAVNTALAAGGTRILVTAATTAQSEDLYNEGFAVIWDASLTSAVYRRRIKKSGALTATGATDTGSYIDIYDALPVALTTNDKVGLQANLYQNIIVAPTTLTGKVLGGVLCAVTASYYCWVQTRGLFPVFLKDVSTNLGAGPVTAGGSTAGTATTTAEAGSGAYDQVFAQATALWLDEYGGFIDLQCE